MIKSLKKFNIIKNRKIKVDDFINRALYKPKIGYYSSKIPFGEKGDFVTSPTISNLFSEIFREPDQQIGYIFGSLSMGMLLSILMIFIGILLLRRK